MVVGGAPDTIEDAKNGEQIWGVGGIEWWAVINNLIGLGPYKGYSKSLDYPK